MSCSWLAAPVDDWVRLPSPSSLPNSWMEFCDLIFLLSAVSLRFSQYVLQLLSRLCCSSEWRVGQKDAVIGELPSFKGLRRLQGWGACFWQLKSLSRYRLLKAVQSVLGKCMCLLVLLLCNTRQILLEVGLMFLLQTYADSYTWASGREKLWSIRKTLPRQREGYRIWMTDGDAVHVALISCCTCCL